MASLKDTLRGVSIQESRDKLKIDPEFQALLDLLSAEETKNLEESVKEEGIREPLIVWEEEHIIVDGHNRYTLAQKHGLPFETKEVSFPNREAVRNWIFRNQLARRNLSRERYYYFMGLLYNQEKAHANVKETAEKIGAQFNQSERTIRRAGDFAAGTDKLEALKGKLAKAAILDGKSDMTRAEVEAVGKTKNQTHATKLVQRLEHRKVTTKQAKAQAKAQVAKLDTKFEAVFAAIDFENESLPIALNRKPPIADNAYLFLYSEDHDLDPNLELMRKWGFVHEGSYVLALPQASSTPWSKLKHAFLLIGSRGIVTGPAKGKEPESIVRCSDPIETCFNVIEKFLPVKAEKRLDMSTERKDWVKL